MTETNKLQRVALVVCAVCFVAAVAHWHSWRVEAQVNSRQLAQQLKVIVGDHLTLPAPCGGLSPCWLMKKEPKFFGAVSNAPPACSSPQNQTYPYYDKIGACLDSQTLEDFELTNQFIRANGSGPNPGVKAFYFNNGDLQLGREMHCNQQGDPQAPRIACYVSNYGPPPFPVGTLDNNTTYPNAAQALAEVEDVAQNGPSATSQPFATVAMVALPTSSKATVTVNESDGGTANANPPKDCLANYSGNHPPSNKDVDTGLDIETGDTITFIATGSIWTGYCFYGTNSADGLSWTADNNPDYPLPSAHDSELIGRIGNGLYFEVGSSSSKKYSGKRGRLFLRTNDNNPGNGNGFFDVTIGVQRDQGVLFYVYGPAVQHCPLPGRSSAPCSPLITFAALDREGAKSAPQMCMACHGGEYDKAKDEAIGSYFLPFDLSNFLYSRKPGLTLANQQEQFRQLNFLVMQTNVNDTNINKPIQNLIDAFYGSRVDIPGTTFVSAQLQQLPIDPTDASHNRTLWVGHEQLYRTFVARYCRTCHVASTSYDFYSFQSFANAPVGQDLCSGQMPHAQVPYTALAGATLDRTAAKDLADIFTLSRSNCLIEPYLITPPAGLPKH